MPQTDIGSAERSETTSFVDYSVAAAETDGVQPTEFTWINKEWTKQLGYYQAIPELQTAVNAKATWTIGAGYEAEDNHKLILDRITGHGKDSFNSIIWNMVCVKTFGGDSYAEIITDDDNLLVNLKPLNPGTMSIVYNNKGRIIRYEQTNVRTKGVTKFDPDKIFHLSRQRVADEIHGVSIIPAVEQIILMRNEAMSDWKKVLHRNVAPLVIWHLDTDDETEIAAFKAKNNTAKADGEDMYIPKGTVEPEIVSIAPNQALNPLQWIEKLNDYFFQTVNVPQIIVGSGKEFTDASGKIVYLAYEQSVKSEQLYVEEQVAAQLNIMIKLTFPASMQNDAISSAPNEMPTPQEERPQQAAEPNNATAELEGKT